MYLYQNRNDCNVSGNTTTDIRLEKMISLTKLPRWPSWHDDGISEASRECSGMPCSGIGASSGKAKSLESVAVLPSFPLPPEACILNRNDKLRPLFMALSANQKSNYSNSVNGAIIPPVELVDAFH